MNEKTATLLDKHRLLEIMRPTVTRSGRAAHYLHHTKPWVVAPHGVMLHTYHYWSNAIQYGGGSLKLRSIDYTDCRQRWITVWSDNRPMAQTVPVLDIVIVELHQPSTRAARGSTERRAAIRMVLVDTAPVGKRVISYQTARLTIAS